MLGLLCLTLLTARMGKGKARGQRYVKAAGDQKDAKLKVVEEWQHLPKKLLKPYADMRGTFLKTDGIAAKKFFALRNFREVCCDAAVSELVARPPMGAHLFAGSAEVGLDALQAVADKSSDTGIEECLNLFKDLAPRLGAMQVTSDLDEATIKHHVSKLVDFAKEDVDAKLKALSKLADTSSRLWVLAIQLAEWLALASRPKAWAKAVPNKDLQHGKIQAWLEEGEDKDKLVDGLAAAMADKFHWGGKSKTTKRKLGDSGSEDAAPPAKARKRAADSSDDSDKNDKKKKKQKKSKKSSKKAGKKKKSSSSSSSASSSSSGKKDDKKDKKDKKSDGKSASPDGKTSADLLKALKKEQALDAFISWKDSDVTEALALAERLLTEPSGPKTVDEMKRLMALFPESVKKTADLADIEPVIKTLTRVPPKTVFDDVVGKLKKVARNAEEHKEGLKKVASAAGGSK